MSKKAFLTQYPLIFFDGEQEHQKGTIGVHSELTFKAFKTRLSRRIRMSAKHLSAVFICRQTRDKEKQQRFPVDENTNFNIILNYYKPSWENSCYFLVYSKNLKLKYNGITRTDIARYENGDGCESDSPTSYSLTDGSRDDDSLPDFISLNEQNELHHRIISEGKSIGTKMILLRRKPEAQAIPECKINGPQVASSFSSQRGQNTALQLSMSYAAQQVRPYLSENRRSQYGNVDYDPAEHNSFTMQSDEAVQVQIRNDSVASPASLTPFQKNGFLGSQAAYVTTPFCSSTLPMVYPSAMAVGALPVPNGSSMGLISGLNSIWNLQDAKAQYLNSQMQHPLQMYMNSNELLKAKDVVPGLASFNSKSCQNSSVCGYCSILKEKNINPIPFHLCPLDRVTKGFHGPSPAGPIERPVKRLQSVQ